MNQILTALLILVSSSSFASEWKELKIDLWGIYFEGPKLAAGLNVKREIKVVGTSGLSWPDGRQAIVTTLETEQLGNKWLARCIQYYSADMKLTGEKCYELRK